MIPGEWLETIIASTKLKKESFRSLYEEVCQGEENVCNRVERLKKFDEEKELGHRELPSQFEKEEA